MGGLLLDFVESRRVFKELRPRVAMAEEGASSRNSTRVRLHGTIIKIPVPLPNILKCGEKSCQGERGSGPWSGDRKRQLAETHIKERHSRRGVQYTTQYVCLGC
ncbi:hypothetical protein OUZ56_011039 [Daphnia magna]|uniref:Uncharacterized protein n=1 Tax=Daphnia magna TaxID=35525 RepID=A0ABQ9YZ58_9CRUS|nr:hypothetical protein OUZ56_011039 [Daphnia magna]